MAKRLRAVRRGFTLIEMLVVMGVIGILVALLMPVIGMVRESAKKSQARTDAVRIESGLVAYFNDYNKFPLTTQGSGDVYSETTASMAIIKALTINGSADAATKELNPRMIPYVAVQGQLADGNCLDPWGSQYAIWLDADYNGSIACYGTNVPGPALVISYGRDKLRGDKGTTTKLGDDIVSHGFQ